YVLRCVLFLLASAACLSNELIDVPMLSPLVHLLFRVLRHRDRLESTDDRDSVSAHRDQSPRQLFQIPPRFTLPADDSAVHSSNLGLVLAKVFVKVDNIE